MRRRRAVRLVGLGAALMALAGTAAAEVRVERLADGSRLVRNLARSAPAIPAPRVAAPVAARVTVAPALAVRPAVLRRPSREELRRLVVDAAAREGVDVRLVEAIVRAESAWNPAALSRVGAIGLMQLMPATASELAVRDPWDAADNVRGGVAYLRRMLDRFDGDLERAVAAYNAGPAAVERYGGVPPYPETRGYVRRVLSAYHGRDVGPVRAGVPSPRVVREADGRLVLTNTAAGR